MAKIAPWSHFCITQILFRQIRTDEEYEDQISMSHYSMLPQTFDRITILVENFKELYETLKSYNEKLLEGFKKRHPLNYIKYMKSKTVVQ